MKQVQIIKMWYANSFLIYKTGFICNNRYYFAKRYELTFLKA